jgi:RNA polymerase sigma factor (sigma-70 family)
MKKPLANAGEIKALRSLPIESLIAGCQKQNPKSQRELFERLSAKMLAVCLKYIKETTAAEDVLIIAFRKVFDRIAQYRQLGSFEAWIRRIVVNECLMHLEKERNFYKQTGLEKIYPQDNHIGPSDHLDWEDLRKLVNSLPKGYRTVFQLFVIDGLSHGEIAQQLEITENTSKSQLSRARAHLQRKFYQVA